MRKFYTFLGISDYFECVYKLMESGWESTPTRFAQVAVCEWLAEQGKPPEEVVVFLTEAARVKNWEDRIKKSGERIAGLHRTLTEKLAPHGSRIKTVQIPEEQADDVLWELFEKIAAEIDDHDHIYLDITHCFRSIPAISLIISNYMRVLKKMKLRGLYYGAYVKQDRKPLYDLTEMLDLFEWTQAVDDYIRTGSAKLLAEVANERPIEKKEDDQFIKLAHLLNHVSMTIETCRGQMIDDAIKQARRQLKLLQENPSRRFKPFQKLLSQIERKLEGYRPDQPEENVIFIVQWCLDHHLYQQGYTLLQEGILTILARYAGLQSDNQYDREKVRNAIYALIYQKQHELAQQWRPLAPYLRFYSALTDCRNNINHGQSTEFKYDHEQLAFKLEEFLQETRKFVRQLKQMSFRYRSGI